MWRVGPEPGHHLDFLLGRRIPGHSLAVFRIFFGVVMFWECWTFMRNDFEKAERYLVEPRVLFHYPGLWWLPRFSSTLVRLWFPVASVMCLASSLGVAWRVVHLGWTLFFFWFSHQDLALYLNHFVLINVLNVLMLFLPMNQTMSFDAWWREWRSNDRNDRSRVPQYSLSVLRFLVASVYLHAAMAKFQSDWLLRCTPLDLWLPLTRPLPISWLAHWQASSTFWFPCFFSWSGFVLDLLAPLGLYHARLRPWALLFVSAFHLTNKWMLNIGIFPWLMLATNVLFLDPNAVARWCGAESASTSRSSMVAKQHWLRYALVGLFLVLWLVPLRHFLYPGSVSWTEQAHMLSWRMKLRDKAGLTRFFVRVDDHLWSIDSLDGLFTPKQQRKMPGRPGDEARRAWPDGRRISVYAVAVASLNGRRPQFLLDPRADLLEFKSWDLPHSFITPLIPWGSSDTRFVPRAYERREWGANADGDMSGLDPVTLQESQREFGINQ